MNIIPADKQSIDQAREIPLQYRTHLSEAEAWDIIKSIDTDKFTRQAARNVVNAFTLIIDSPFINIPTSMEFQRANDVYSYMFNICYAAGTIWFYDKSIEDIMEIYEILCGSLLEIIKKAKPLDKEDQIIIDFKRMDSDLYKLYGIMYVAEVHNDGNIYYEERRNLKSILANLNGIREGIIHNINHTINLRFTYNTES